MTRSFLAGYFVICGVYFAVKAASYPESSIAIPVVFGGALFGGFAAWLWRSARHE
jgi:hypothetical protein